MTTNTTTSSGTDLDLDQLEALANRRLNGALSLSGAEALALIELARRASPQPVAPDEQAQFEAWLNRHIGSCNAPKFLAHAGMGDEYDKGLTEYRAKWRATQHPSAAPSEDVLVFAIHVEKMLCAALGREWSTAGISIETLIAELKVRVAAPSAQIADAKVQSDIQQVIEALGLCEPEDQEAFKRLLAHFQGAK